MLATSGSLDATMGGTLLGSGDHDYVTNDQSGNAARYDLSTARRLGYLLNVIGHHTLAADFHARLTARPEPPIRLDVSAPAGAGAIDPLWHLIINTTVEPD